jgi:hypothetical protein
MKTLKYEQYQKGVVNDSCEGNPAVSKKQLAAEQKARREVHLQYLIEDTT